MDVREVSRRSAVIRARRARLGKPILGAISAAHSCRQNVRAQRHQDSHCFKHSRSLSDLRPGFGQRHSHPLELPRISVARDGVGLLRRCVAFLARDGSGTHPVLASRPTKPITSANAPIQDSNALSIRVPLRLSKRGRDFIPQSATQPSCGKTRLRHCRQPITTFGPAFPGWVAGAVTVSHARLPCAQSPSIPGRAGVWDWRDRTADSRYSGRGSNSPPRASRLRSESFGGQESSGVPTRAYKAPGRDWSRAVATPPRARPGTIHGATSV